MECRRCKTDREPSDFYYYKGQPSRRCIPCMKADSKIQHEKKMKDKPKKVPVNVARYQALTQEQKDNIQKDLDDRMKLCGIAAKYDIPLHTLSTWFKPEFAYFIKK